MTLRDRLLLETKDMPEFLLQRIIDHVRLLKTGGVDTQSEMVINEVTVARDWWSPEEDEAWMYL